MTVTSGTSRRRWDSDSDEDDDSDDASAAGGGGKKRGVGVRSGGGGGGVTGVKGDQRDSAKRRKHGESGSTGVGFKPGKRALSVGTCYSHKIQTITIQLTSDKSQNCKLILLQIWVHLTSGLLSNSDVWGSSVVGACLE